MKHLLTLGLLLTLITGCSEDKDKPKPKNKDASGWFSVFSDTDTSANKLSIVSLDGTPLSGAQILIGSHEGALADNFLITDENGQAPIPSSWTGAETITVQAPGYLRMSVIGAEPQAQTFKLRKLANAQKIELKGTTTGHKIVDRDGLLDFGLVIPALTKTDLLAFSIDSVISSEYDTIKVAGQELSIPSNITLPRQKESYIIPITIEKPLYRVYFDEPGKIERVFAAKGRFPFKSVANQMRNGAKFYDLINEFSILSGSVRDIEINAANNKADIPTTELIFDEKRQVIGPNLAKDELAIAVGISNISGYLIPTDVKRIPSKGSGNINTISQSDASLLTVIKRNSEMEGFGPGMARMSASLLPFESNNTTPNLLPLMENPTVVSARELKVPNVNPIAGVNPIATYSTVMSLTEKTIGRDKIILTQPIWEVYAPNWSDSIKLPEWPNEKSSGKKRWQVALIGSSTATEAEMNPNVVNDVTHVTTSSTDF